MKETLFILYTRYILLFPVSAQQIPSFKANDRTVFLGNNIMGGGHYHSYIWLYYMMHFPELPLRIYNGGVGSDCTNHVVFRFDSDIKTKKPTYLACSFGMNDSGYGRYNKPGYDKYANKQTGYANTEFGKLQQQILADKKIKNVVLLGSSPYDGNVKLEGVGTLRRKNETIKRIIEVRAEVVQKRGWGFVNFNTVMCELNKEIQQSDSTTTFCGDDRTHPNKDDHMVVAYLFLKAQGLVGKEVVYFHINATNRKATEEGNCRITHIENENDTISFSYLSRSLPFPVDTIPRWGTKGAARDAVR